MIIVKLISGLGNQLFQYSVGRKLAIERGVPLKLDISFFSNQSLRSFKLNNYNIKAEIATNKEIDKLIGIYSNSSFLSKIYRKVEEQLPKYKKRLYKEREWWVYEPELYKASSKVYLDGYWQHYKYMENLPDEIFQELTAKEPYSSTVQNLLSEILSNRDSVSLHIRRGDYISDLNAYNFMGVMPIEYYKEAIQYIKERTINTSFYIFSDDLNWVKDNLKIDGPVTLMDIENGKKDFIELDIMSKCSHNIIANSSFSWWGAFLNRNPNKIVIAPKRWVVPEDVNKRINIQFPSWIKM